jgi:hypothetical protein
VKDLGGIIQGKQKLADIKNFNKMLILVPLPLAGD